MHLFDVNIPGKIVAFESKKITKGDNFGIFDIGFIKIGIGICHDIRFAEYYLLLRKEHNVDMLIFPSAFNTVTGPLFWELLARSRAIDNQVYVAMCSQSRNYENPNDYQTWGHSMIVDPYGQIVTSTGYEEDIIIANIDLNKVKEFRQNIPIWDQKRWDLFSLEELKQM
jgi:omega-amidase